MKEARTTIEQLRASILYQPETGKFFSTRTGKSVGFKAGGGYVGVWVAGESFQAHRVALAITRGEWPAQHVDHINGEKADNRLANLRDCSQMENRHNTRKRICNTSGATGVAWHAASSKWQVRISINRKRIHIGLFSNTDDAARAYAAAAIKHYGEFTPEHVAAIAV